MNLFKDLTRYDIEKALNPEQLRTTQIIIFAILMGSIVFLIPINIISAAKPEAIGPVTTSDFEQTFRYAVLIIAVFAYSLIYFFPGIFQTKTAIIKRIENAGPIKDKKQAAYLIVAIDRQFRLIKNALFESVSLIALVGIFLEVLSSSYRLAGSVWLLALPIVIHTVYVILNFPSKEKITNDIERHILTQLHS